MNTDEESQFVSFTPHPCDPCNRWSTRTLKHPRGFTVIELLVVITVIAILAGLAFPVFQAVQEQAKRTQAKNDLLQIVTAVNAYYTEYGKYPLATVDGSADIVFRAAPTNENLFDVLRATGLGRDTVDPNDTTGNKNLNLRRIVFISPPDVKDPSNPRSGIGTDRQYYDPWGTTYAIKIDGTYDGSISNPYSLGAGSVSLRSGVLAWSFGKDKTSSSIPGPASDKNTGTNKDDVISWQ